MKKVVILGTGSFAREIVSFLQGSDQYKVIGLTDIKPSLKGISIAGIPVLGDDNILIELFGDNVQYAFVAVANSIIRERLFKKICAIGFNPINIIHPSAVIASDVSFGQGIVIYPHVTINTDVSIGDSVLINSNVSIGHDTKIEDFVNINPGVNIAGKVNVHKHAFLGIGCSVLENIVIGCRATVGGGALVNKEVLAETKVAGVPARPIALLKN